MKLFVLILVHFIFISKACCQTVIEIEIGPRRKVTHVTVAGTLPDGDSVMRRSLVKRLSSAVFKGIKKGKYTVTVYYIVAKDGSISDIRCINDPGYGICEEAVRIFKKTTPWRPARQNGIQVKTYRTSYTSVPD